MSVAYKINEELNGIELYFDSKPAQDVLTNLKSNGFRWSGFKKCWYNKQSEKAFKVAEDLTNNTLNIEPQTETKAATETTRKAKKSNNTLSLWDATQCQDIEVNREQDTKQMAKEIRSHLRKRFPQCKFSITSDYNHIHAEIKSSPYEMESQYLQAVKDYCNKFINNYNVCYDPGDSMTDLPAHYNFYFFNTNIYEWGYTQTEQTKSIKKDMADFDGKLIEHERAEKERRKREIEEFTKQRKQEEIEFKKFQEEEQKQIKHIYNSIDVKELTENDQYFVISSEFADLNKNNTLDQYKEEVQKGDFTLNDVQITKEIHFTDQQALNNFSNMLLNDFDFLTETGGSFTNDNRLNSMTDFYNMDDDEQETVKWYVYGVAVYFENKLQFVVDAQGHSYAHYVGLTDNATIKKTVDTPQVVEGEELEQLKQKADQLEDMSTEVITGLNIVDSWNKDNWNEYKESMKNKLKDYNFKLTKAIVQQTEVEEFKTAIYRLLQEVDSIQEQFKDANLKQGERLTLFYIADWGTITKQRITFDNFTCTKYAQYDNAVRLEFTSERKRKQYYKYFYSTLLVFKGWHSLPDEVLNDIEYSNGMKITKSKYMSTDHKQYDEILKYFEGQGIKPTINTYKPSI